MAQFSADDSRQETNEAIYHDQASTCEEDLSITDDNLSEDQTVDGEVVRNEEGTKHDIDVHTQEQETDADTKAEERDEFNFLATLFQDKDEEQETYSSMRICIVQENDTLETIAERYH